VNKTIYPLVEGDGEVTAAPELLRRLLDEQFQRYDFVVHRPINAGGCYNLDRRFEDFLEITRRAPDCNGVIVLRDAERDHAACPLALALGLAERAAALHLRFPVVIVCANCEYESWFLASLGTIKPGYLNAEAVFEGDPEQECNAKGWLSKQMLGQRVYKETLDQVRMTALLDLAHTIRHSRSFRRLVHAVEELIQAMDDQQSIVTPLSVPPKESKN
jgi:hypothetical protein